MHKQPVTQFFIKVCSLEAHSGTMLTLYNARKEMGKRQFVEFVGLSNNAHEFAPAVMEGLSYHN